MDGRFAPAQLEIWMTGLFARKIYLALFASSPFGTDPLAVEIVGGAYSRVLAHFERTDPFAMTLDMDVPFRSLLPGTTVYAVGGFDANVNGNLIFGDHLPIPRIFTTGGTYTVEAGELVLGLHIPAPNPLSVPLP